MPISGMPDNISPSDLGVHSLRPKEPPSAPPGEGAAAAKTSQVAQGAGLTRISGVEAEVQRVPIPMNRDTGGESLAPSPEMMARSVADVVDYTSLPKPSREIIEYTSLPEPSREIIDYKSLPEPSGEKVDYTSLPEPSREIIDYKSLPEPNLEGTPTEVGGSRVSDDTSVSDEDWLLPTDDDVYGVMALGDEKASESEGSSTGQVKKGTFEERLAAAKAKREAEKPEVLGRDQAGEYGAMPLGDEKASESEGSSTGQVKKGTFEERLAAAKAKREAEKSEVLGRAQAGGQDAETSIGQGEISESSQQYQPIPNVDDDYVYEPLPDLSSEGVSTSRAESSPSGTVGEGRMASESAVRSREIRAPSQTKMSSGLDHLEGKQLVVDERVASGGVLESDKADGKDHAVKDMTPAVKQSGVRRKVRGLSKRIFGKKRAAQKAPKPLTERKVEVLKFQTGKELARGNFKRTMVVDVDRAGSDAIASSTPPSKYVLQEYLVAEEEMTAVDLEEKRNEEAANKAIYEQHQKDPSSVSNLAFGKPIEFTSSDGTKRTAYIAERADKGSVTSTGTGKMKEIPREQRGSYSVQMARGVAQLHALGKVHGDVKPDNFLVSSGEDGDIVKLTDYGKTCDPGTSMIGEGDNKKQLPLRYYDPHAIIGNPELTQQNDVYSLGLNIYMAYTGTEMEEMTAAFDAQHTQDGNPAEGFMKARANENVFTSHPKDQLAMEKREQRTLNYQKIKTIEALMDEFKAGMESGQIDVEDIRDEYNQLAKRREGLIEESISLHKEAVQLHRQAISENFSAYIDLNKIDNDKVRAVVRDILHNPPGTRPTAAEVAERLDRALSGS